MIFQILLLLSNLLLWHQTLYFLVSLLGLPFWWSIYYLPIFFILDYWYLDFLMRNFIANFALVVNWWNPINSNLMTVNHFAWTMDFLLSLYLLSFQWSWTYLSQLIFLNRLIYQLQFLTRVVYLAWTEEVMEKQIR